MKYVIIGGVAGGATAAARLRRVDEMAEILLLEKGPYISYANCGLPYYIGGVIAEREKLLVQTPESFGKRFRIDVRVQNEVIAIHPKNKTVTIRNAEGKEYDESYDKLLLSPGANPVKPPLEGINSEGIFTLRNVEDTDHIKAYISDKQVKRAVVVGAGFIGLEMAENLHHAGVHVSVVEMGNQVMAPIDFSMAAPIHQHLLQKGVSLYLEEGVTHFKRTDNGITVFLKSGKAIPADMVLLSIGVRPATALAQQAGLKLGEMGGIWVDYELQTTIKGLFAIGECNFSDHGANRLGASALMQGLADGYFVLPYTIQNYLADQITVPRFSTDLPEFAAAEKAVQEKIDWMMNIKGKKSVDSIHKELGHVMWEYVGMGRTAEGLKEGLKKMKEIRKEFETNLFIPGDKEGMNVELDKAIRLYDFITMGELVAYDALNRNESCGGHFREEYQTEEGEAKRDDENYFYVACWEYQGSDEKEPVLLKEPLVYEAIKVQTRNYKS